MQPWFTSPIEGQGEFHVHEFQGADGARRLLTTQQTSSAPSSASRTPAILRIGHFAYSYLARAKVWGDKRPPCPSLAFRTCDAINFPSPASSTHNARLASTHGPWPVSRAIPLAEYQRGHRADTPPIWA